MDRCTDQWDNDPEEQLFQWEFAAGESLFAARAILEISWLRRSPGFCFFRLGSFTRRFGQPKGTGIYATWAPLTKMDLRQLYISPNTNGLTNGCVFLTGGTQAAKQIIDLRNIDFAPTAAELADIGGEASNFQLGSNTTGVRHTASQCGSIRMFNCRVRRMSNNGVSIEQQFYWTKSANHVQLWMYDCEMHFCGHGLQHNIYVHSGELVLLVRCLSWGAAAVHAYKIDAQRLIMLNCTGVQKDNFGHNAGAPILNYTSSIDTYCYGNFY